MNFSGTVYSMDYSQLVTQLFELIYAGHWGFAIAFAVHFGVKWLESNRALWANRLSRPLKTAAGIALAAAIAGLQSFLSEHDMINIGENVAIASLIVGSSLGMKPANDIEHNSSSTADDIAAA